MDYQKPLPVLMLIKIGSEKRKLELGNLFFGYILLLVSLKAQSKTV